MTIADAYERGWRDGLEDARQILLRASGGRAGDGEGITTGYEWHNRRRDPQGRFAADPGREGLPMAQLHVRLPLDRLYAIGAAAARNQQNMTEYVDQAIQERMDAENARTSGGHTDD